MLIVEDGTGLPDADSFVSLDDANQFWLDRNIAKWASASDAEREAALRQGADYLALGFRWPGQPTVSAQRLVWPRQGGYDREGYAISPNSVPGAVRDANILLGLEALGGNILTTATAEPALTRKSVALGGGFNVTREYSSASQPRGLKRFPAVDSMLGFLAAPRGSGGFRVQRLIRA